MVQLRFSNEANAVRRSCELERFDRSAARRTSPASYDLSPSSLWEREPRRVQAVSGTNHGIASARCTDSSISGARLRRRRGVRVTSAERSLELHRRARNDKGAVQPLASPRRARIPTRAIRRQGARAAPAERRPGCAKIGWRWWRAGTLSALAEVAIADGRDADAQTPARANPSSLRSSLGDRVGLSWYLSQTALALARQGRSEESGDWGAVEASAVFIPGGPCPGLREASNGVARAEEQRLRPWPRGRASGITLEDAARSILA